LLFLRNDRSVEMTAGKRGKLGSHPGATHLTFAFSINKLTLINLFLRLSKIDKIL